MQSVAIETDFGQKKKWIRPAVLAVIEYTLRSASWVGTVDDKGIGINDELEPGSIQRRSIHDFVAPISGPDHTTAITRTIARMLHAHILIQDHGCDYGAIWPSSVLCAVHMKVRQLAVD